MNFKCTNWNNFIFGFRKSLCTDQSINFPRKKASFFCHFQSHILFPVILMWKKSDNCNDYSNKLNIKSTKPRKVYYKNIYIVYKKKSHKHCMNICNEFKHQYSVNVDLGWKLNAPFFSRNSIAQKRHTQISYSVNIIC